MIRKIISRAFLIDAFYTAFRFDWDESFTFTGESHGFWEAVYVKSGAVEVTEDENIYTLGEGNIIFHAPMEFHRIKSAQNTSPTVYVISFSVSGTPPEALRRGVFSLEPSLCREYEEICRKALEFIRSEDGIQSGEQMSEGEATEKELFGQELSDRLSLFLIRLSSRASHGGISMSQSAMEYRKIVSFMSEQVMESMTLLEIAKKNNISISYIKLLFKTYAGVSPKIYFNQLRLRRAAELLREGRGISEVADVMNFSSPSYFSAFYKRLTGASPTEQQKSDVLN